MSSSGKDVVASRLSACSAMLERLRFVNVVAISNAAVTVWTYYCDGVVVARYLPVGRQLTLGAREPFYCQSPDAAAKLICEAQQSGILYLPIVEALRGSDIVQEFEGVTCYQHPCGHRLFYADGCLLCRYDPRMGSLICGGVQHYCPSHAAAWTHAKKIRDECHVGSNV